MNAPRTVWLNGSLMPQHEARVSVADRGFLYGDAAFETVAVYGGRPFRLDAHLRRLEDSVRAMRFPAGIEADALRAPVHEVIAANRLDDGLVRLCLTRGRTARGLDPRGATDPSMLVSAHLPPHLTTPDNEGARLVVSNLRRVPPQCLPAQAKHANMLNNILAKAEAGDADAYEALMLTVEGHVAECSHSNIFFVAGGRLCTPPLSLGVLPGITRDAVLGLARDKSLVVDEFPAGLDSVLQAEEVFVTNTTVGVMPVFAIGSCRYLAPGPVTAMLREAYWRLVEAEAGLRW